MNKRKLLTLAMTLCMVAILAIGGTLAYFSDADKDVNVMTTANIKIVQNETDRNGKAYTDGQKLYPAVYLDAEGKPYNPTSTGAGPIAYEGYTGPDGENMNMYADKIENEIDKVVSVTNNGDVEAYVRTIILIENTNHMLKNNLHMNYSGSGWTVESDFITVDEQDYDVWVFTLDGTLAAGKTSPASMKQLWLDPTTNSDWYKNLGDDNKLTVIALSQASQVAGFKTADDSLNTAFGEVNATNLSKWINETGIDTTAAANVVGGGN